jgi:hypothetical protein
MKDVMGLNELFHDGWVLGDVLAFGGESHLFILFKPPKGELDGDGWKGGDDDDDDQ